MMTSACRPEGALAQAKRVKAKITDAENRPTLRRDPATGEYRL